MAKFASCLLAASVAALVACGGGGSGSGGTASLPTDSDPKATPPQDPAYYGVPSTALGAQVSGSTVTFTCWNPSAASVTVQLYANWDDALASPAATLPLAKGDGAVWTSGPVPLPTQPYYAYKADGAFVLDPYARSMAQWVHAGGATIPGDAAGKGAILDTSGILPDGGWGPQAYFDGSAMVDPSGAPAPYAYGAGRDAIIYEAGVRDLTVDPFLAGFAPGHRWGTFKGLVDVLPHIRRLGVTHVQLLCPLENYFYDQTKNGQREMNPAQTSGANYNWGYDPQNWFTPSGMYSAQPLDPAARVNELKTLVNEIHRQGMGVILDVVFNHTANNQVLDPAGYMYRASSANGAGSQDVATEHKMVRKLLVDAVSHWVGEYRVDGFRFDLMGDLDTGTIRRAYEAATALNPNALFVGEGWNGYYSGAATDYLGAAIAGSDQKDASAFAGMNVAMFSDSYRNLFKNGYPSDGAPAFLTGAPQAPAALFANASGRPTNFTAPSTSNVVNYLSCHDNLCYYDVLALASGASKAQDAGVLQRAKVGYAVLLTSQGVAFLQAGDEMFRSKETTAASGSPNTKAGNGRVFVDNSYNASDAVNLVAWSRCYATDPIAGAFATYDTSQYGFQLYAYTQGLVALRKHTNAFRLPDASLASNFTALPADGAGSTALAFGYKAVATDATGTYYVFHNAGTTAATFTADADLGAAEVLVDGSTAGTTPIAMPDGVAVSGTRVTLAPLTSAVLKP